MHTDIFSIKECNDHHYDHFMENNQRLQAGQCLPALDKILPALGSPTKSREKRLSNVPSCDDCGIVFENIHDLQNHIKRWCQESVQNHVKRQECYGLREQLKRETPIHPDADDNDVMSYVSILHTTFAYLT